MYRGVVRKYRPDFLVRFRSGLTLILEIKGRYTDHAKEKNAALQTWVRAVNQDTRFGQWASTVCTDPTTLPTTLTHYATRPTTHSPSNPRSATGHNPLPSRPPTRTEAHLLTPAA